MTNITTPSQYVLRVRPKSMNFNSKRQALKGKRITTGRDRDVLRTDITEANISNLKISDQQQPGLGPDIGSYRFKYRSVSPALAYGQTNPLINYEKMTQQMQLKYQRLLEPKELCDLLETNEQIQQSTNHMAKRKNSRQKASALEAKLREQLQKPEKEFVPIEPKMILPDHNY